MKRYDIFYPVPQCSARMEENGDGDYVLWDDVKHLVAPAQQATNRPMPQLLDKLEAVRVMLSGPGAVPNDERAMAYDELDSVIEQLRQ